MSRLVLVRHGQSEWNLENLFTGWVDVDLSLQGIEEAKKAGQKIKERGMTFDQAYTSSLKRAIKTLHYILEESDQLWVPEVKTWRLNERHYGALQGKNKAETAEQYGADQVQIWRRSYDAVIPPLDKGEGGSIYEKGAYAHLDPRTIPNGENLKMTLERVIPFWQDNLAPDLRAGKDVLIAAHGNSLRALTKYLEKISDEDIMGVEMVTGQPIVYELTHKLEIISKEVL